MALPFIIPSSTLSVSSSSGLLTYRRALADELGMLHVMLVGAASAGDTTRVVLADDLRDDEAGYALWGTPWVYVTTGAQAGAQRRVLDQMGTGYQGPAGALLVSRQFNAALLAGTTVEITSPLPVARHLGVKGLNDCVNEALARTPAVATLTLELTGGSTDSLSLDDYPWLTHEDQILSIRDRYGVVGVNAARSTGLPYRIDADGATRSLVFGRSYSPGETVEVRVSLPGDRLIYDGSAWAFATDDPGLQDDDDRAAVPDHWVLAFGMVAALRFLERLVARRRDIDKDERADMLGEIRERLAQWSITAQRLRLTEFPRGEPRRSASLLGTTLTRTDSTITDPTGSAWP